MRIGIHLGPVWLSGSTRRRPRRQLSEAERRRQQQGCTILAVLLLVAVIIGSIVGGVIWLVRHTGPWLVHNPGTSIPVGILVLCGPVWLIDRRRRRQPRQSRRS